ncbi:MAG: hypothetical protein AAGD13_18505 [Pseudomonadota bacterium]
MLRVLILVTALFAAIPGYGAPLHAEPLARLDQPSQTAMIEAGPLRVVAFYNVHDEVLDLTVLITDQEGETLRTRVALRDRQHHALTLSDEREDQTTYRIEFLRTGAQIEVAVRDVAEVSDLAAR